MGKTYLFYDKHLYAEIDECTFYVKRYGRISDKFIGIPISIDSAFRYINGMIYFFQGDTYYEYNQFGNKLEKSGKISDLFTLLTKTQCPDIDILQQWKNLVLKLTNNRADYSADYEYEE